MLVGLQGANVSFVESHGKRPNLQSVEFDEHQKKRKRYTRVLRVGLLLFLHIFLTISWLLYSTIGNSVLFSMTASSSETLIGLSRCFKKNMFNRSVLPRFSSGVAFTSTARGVAVREARGS